MADCTGSGGGGIAELLSFVTNPVGAIINMIAKMLLTAAMSIYALMTRVIPGLDIGSSQRVDQKTQWVVVYLAVGSLIYAAARMAYERKGNAGEAALKGILRLLFVSAAGTAVIGTATVLAENWANHLFSSAVKQMLTGIGCTEPGTGTTEGILLLVLAFLLLISAIVQVVLLYIRLGVMVVLLGTLPVAAAASMTDWGVGWWRKHLGWMVAWILYKPAAALVMYAGATMINSSTFDVNRKLGGIGLMLLAAVALPALLKIIVPAIGALGSGGSDQRGMSPGMGAVASGAKKIGGAAATKGVSLAQNGIRGATGASNKGPSGGSGQSGKPAPQPAAAKQGGGQSGGQGGGQGGGQSGGQSGGQGGGLPTGARRPSTGAAASGGGNPATGGGNPATQGAPAAARAAGPVGMAAGAVASGAVHAASALPRTAAGAIKDAEGDADGGGPRGANQ
nr:hypothetical protein [Kibdelosporangium sp. MJ126-NF4]CEL15627.1 Protein sequence is in conflict with the conceptual translation; (MTV016.44c), len: 484. Member of the M. tuberculosis PE-PGRS group of Gly, Ala-rich proteins. Appears to be a gene fragment, should be in-frame with following orf, MTV016.45c, frameshift required around 49595 but couldnot be found on checking BAC and cosmid clones. FASTA scores: Z95844/MTCY493_4 Mycobacterium tuberculosis cosmid (1329 aa) opt: 1457 z-score: 821.7 E(